MIPEAGAFELVFLAAVALIVVGPKDLPILLRKVGEFTRKMRGLADDFRHSFDEMARQSELDELRREVDALREGKLTEATGAAVGEFTAVAEHLSGPAHEAAYGVADPALAAPGAASELVAALVAASGPVAEPELPLPEPVAAHAEPPHPELFPVPAEAAPAEPRPQMLPLAAAGSR